MCQSFNPSIQIKKARDSYAQLTDRDKKIACADSIGHYDVQIYCLNLHALFFPTTLPVSFASYMVAKQDPSVLESAINSFLSSAAESRIDSQNGASAGGSGTTSAVERSGISDVLGVALEAGAVTQTVSGSNLTLQGNALSLYRFATSQEVFQYCPQEQADCRGDLEKYLNKISGSATLGLSNASTQTVKGTVAGPTAAPGTNSQTSAAALIQNSAFSPDRAQRAFPANQHARR